jgi:hypothetical protein
MTENRFIGHYDLWTQNRINWIFSQFEDDFFVNQTILDLGGGRGHLVKMLSTKKPKSIEIVEGRLNNFSKEFEYSFNNLEYTLTTKRNQYDIVFNFGILYHITNWQVFLLNAINKTKHYMFFETEVLDDDTLETFYQLENSTQYDQAISGLGSRPTEFMIESFLDKLPFVEYTKIKDEKLNADFHRYDWQNQYNFNIENGLRRFYVIKIKTTTLLQKIKNIFFLKLLKKELFQNKMLELLTHTLKHEKITEDKLHQIILRLEYLEKKL